MEIRDELLPEYSRDVILHVRAADGRILAANAAAIRAYGYSRDELQSLSIYDLRADHTLPRTAAQMAEADAHSILFETEHRRKDGSTFPVEVGSQGVAIGGVRTLISVIRDITERRRIELELRRSEERERARAGEFAAILDAVPFVTLIARDPECRLIAGSRMTYQLLRAEPGTNLAASLAAGHFRAVRNGAEVAPPDLPVHTAARTGQAVNDYEFDVIFADGSRRTLFGSAIPLLDDDGRTRGALGAFLDITERQAMEERLREAQKLESIGLLAGGIAHDFNNLLVGVIGNASLAADLVPNGSPALEKLRRVLEAGEQAAHLTRQMLDYAGKGRFIVAPVDLSQIVRENSALVRSSISQNISLTFHLAEDLPCVESDPAQMRQLFMNLVLNAAEAIGEGAGAIAISTGEMQIAGAHLPDDLANWPLQPGRCVFLEVSDTGCGMDSATHAKVFDPFFTTKFQGRGLGLAAVAGVVRSHHGAIRVTTAPGRGATFQVLLPAMRSAPAPHADPHGQGAVLVVDDEPQVRGLAQAALECQGYQVLTAESGSQAVDLVRARGSGIRVVILDLGSPEMHAEEALAELRRLQPGLEIVLSGGGSEVQSLREFHGLRLSGFIRKPYTVQDLARVVQRAMPAPK
jgi:PAS domain S-box-containing protein